MQTAHRPLQHPHPLFELFGLIDFFRFFHAYHLSSAAIAILPHPPGQGLVALDPILASQLVKRKPARLQLPHHAHFKRFTVSNYFPIPW